MDENRFFRFVWRFNGIAMLLILVTAIVMTAIGFYRLLDEAGRARPARTVVNVAAGWDVEQRWEFGHLQTVAGTSYVILPLEVERGYAKSYSGDSGGATHNLLFIDSAGSSRRWLYPSNDFLIVDYTLLADPPEHAGGARVTAILYTVAKRDTDHDERLTRGDALSIALSRPDGSAYREILDGLENVLGHSRVDRNTLLLVYQKQEVTYTVTIGLRDFSLHGGGPLPKVGP